MSQFFVGTTSGNLPPTVAQSFITNPATGTAVPAAGVLTFAANGGSFSASGSTVTFTVTGTGIPWTDQAVSFLSGSNQGYFCTAALTITMPAAPVQGDIIFVISDSVGIITLQANGGQKFRVGTQLSAVAGTCVNANIGDAIEFVYRASDSIWFCSNSPQGTWTTT